MKRRRFVAAASSFPLLAGCTGSGSPDPPTEVGETRTLSAESTAPPVVDGLQVPDGFRVSAFADDASLGGGEFRPGPEPGPRLLAAHDGVIYVTIPSQGRVVAFPAVEDGRAAAVTTVVADLDRPHGIDFLDGQVYLATADQILRYDLTDVAVAPDSKTVLVDDIPAGKSHWTRTIAIHDGGLYLSAGNCHSGDCSAGNDAYLAAVTRFDLDGSNPTTYATGLRNAVGLDWHDGRLFAADNGRDDLGPDLPPDEVNVVEEGGDYGFPDCYGANVPADDSVSAENCAGTVPARVELPPHCALLGFDFSGDSFPADYRGDMFLALHGSWRREDPTGFELVRVPYNEGRLGSAETFLSGWLPEGKSMKEATGRPVDVLAHDGTLFVSDDLAGRIHRIDAV